MHKPLLQEYRDLKESGSASDWPNLLANVMYKTLLKAFGGVASPWKQYTIQGNLADFKSADRDLVTGAPDLLEIEDDGKYQDSKISDYKYQIQLKTFGRTFTVGRKAIINDDLNVLRQQPTRFGIAAARTLAHAIS